MTNEPMPEAGPTALHIVADQLETLGISPEHWEEIVGALATIGGSKVQDLLASVCDVGAAAKRFASVWMRKAPLSATYQSATEVQVEAADLERLPDQARDLIRNHTQRVTADIMERMRRHMTGEGATPIRTGYEPTLRGIAELLRVDGRSEPLWPDRPEYRIGIDPGAIDHASHAAYVQHRLVMSGQLVSDRFLREYQAEPHLGVQPQCWPCGGTGKTADSRRDCSACGGSGRGADHAARVISRLP